MRRKREPEPGTKPFGERAKERRERIRSRDDLAVTDIVSGKKKGLKKRKRQMEESYD